MCRGGRFAPSRVNVLSGDHARSRVTRNKPAKRHPRERRWIDVTTTTAIATTQRVIPVANLDLSLREGGEGPAVVLLHRSTGTLGWDTLEEKLAERFRVITPDLPGYGASERPDWSREGSP